MYSPYSHQIWTIFEKFICTYSFFKVQNKETKNKQPLTAKHHLALWPCSLSDTVQQCMEGRCQCRPPFPPHSQQLGGYVFEGTLCTLKASRLYLEGYFILAGSPTMLFFFPLQGLPTKALGRRHAALKRASLSDWPLTYVSTTMTGCGSDTNTTTKRKSDEDIERVGNGLKSKLKNLCPCCKNPLHAFMILLSPSCQSLQWNKTSGKRR